MDVKALYDSGKLTEAQLVRLVRLGILGNAIGITTAQFAEITGKDISEVISLEKAKTLQHGAINGERENKQKHAVVTFNDDTFEVNEKSQQNMNSINQAAMLDIQNGGSTIFPFRSATNRTHDFTAQQIIQLALMMVAKVSEIYNESWNLKAQVDAAETVEDVLSIK